MKSDQSNMPRRNPHRTQTSKRTISQLTANWFAVPLLLALVGIILLSPVFAVLISFFRDTGATQDHIWTTRGITYLRGTLFLCFMVAVIAGTLGTITAALVSLTDMPGRRIISFLLVLPFAIPAYISAYSYGDFLAPFGGLAMITGAAPTWANALRTLPGGALILSLAVYPYVYLALRADLSSRSAAYSEAARSLGAGPIVTFFRILLPGARAALLAGLSLALMETAADFGVSDYFGIQTLSVGIFRTWYGLGDLTAAAQIAGGLFLVAALLLVIEVAGRRGERSESIRAHRYSALFKLSPLFKILAIAFCLIPIVLGFIVPLSVLFSKLPSQDNLLRIDVFQSAFVNTTTISLISIIVIMALSITLALIKRGSKAPIVGYLIRIMTIGYAVPGSVIAIGILSAGSYLLTPLNISITIGGIFLLLYAYTIRFLTAGFNASDAGFAQINPNMDMAARSLGAHPGRIMSAIHIPLAKRSLIVGGIIVFIDVARELPATLLLRSFNFETLATQVYRLASDERLGAASPAALMLVAAGVIPVLVLTLLTNKTASQQQS